MRAWLSAGILLACLSACGPSGSPSEDSASSGTGQARISMTGTGSDGATYQLVGWTLQFDGPESVTVDEATSSDPVMVSLKAGTYSLTLGGDWHVERTDAPGVPVEVALVSPNPLGFVVRANEDTPVRLIFKLLPEGSATVAMGIDAGGWISGSFFLDSSASSGGTGIFDGLVAQTLNLTISYESSRVTYDTWRTTLTTDPVTVQFGGVSGSVLYGEFAPALSGQPLVVELNADPNGDGVFFGVYPLVAYSGPVYHQLLLSLRPAAGSLDVGGNPRLGTYVTDAELEISNDQATLHGTGQVTLELR